MSNIFLQAVLAALLVPACNSGDPARMPVDHPLADAQTKHLTPDLTAFNVEQHTCALYVALRSRALESSISFGRDLEEVDIHWNMCPGGTMVACATAPAPGGGTIITGIPWPYRSKTKH
ncbi:MAG TPA: hypothetical protein PKD45_01910 [Flavobacteriales bacterium]|nr:hypothetical protein [Flavobacteriales bacterium]